jgi:hypothetical protein
MNIFSNYCNSRIKGIEQKIYGEFFWKNSLGKERRALMASLEGISEDKITAYTYQKYSSNKPVMEFTYRIRQINLRLDKLHHSKSELKAGRFLPNFCRNFVFLALYFIFWISFCIYLIVENSSHTLIVFVLGLLIFIMFRKYSMYEYERNKDFIMDDRTSVDL